MLHIQLTGGSKEHHASKYTTLTHTLDPGVRLKGKTKLKVAMLHIKLKEKEV